MPFYELSFFCRSIFALWSLLLCVAGIIGIVFSVALKRYKYTLFSLVLFTPAYTLWQVTLNLYRYGIADNPYGFCVKLCSLPVSVWVLVLILLSVVTALPLYLNGSRIKTDITPLAIKQCADKMWVGICYWRENGHIVFFNDCMNRLCIAVTGEALMNGTGFYNAVSDGIIPVNGSVWNFTFRTLELDGEPLYEAVAWDVTEINAKTEVLKKDNEELALLNEQLKEYSLKIDDTVRRQEILQAKANIHDEMNRLMLSTVAADANDEEDLNRIFALWEKNALLLCLEADERKNKNAVERIENLSQALNIKLKWNSELPDSLIGNQRELFFSAAQEAVANAVKHANAKNMEISFNETEDEIHCCFKNDGRLPENEVRFTGGLANLEALANEQNAAVFVKAEEAFRLYLIFKKL